MSATDLPLRGGCGSHISWTGLRGSPHIGGCRREARNVKRWQSGEQALRWTAAGLEQAANGWRRLRGHHPMSVLLARLKRHIDAIDQEGNAARIAA